MSIKVKKSLRRLFLRLIAAWRVLTIRNFILIFGITEFIKDGKMARRLNVLRRTDYVGDSDRLSCMGAAKMCELNYIESDVFPSNTLHQLLDVFDMLKIGAVTFSAYSFPEESLLDTNDKDFVTFHKTKEYPMIVDEIMRCTYETTETPIHNDWYMTINYHS